MTQIYCLRCKSIQEIKIQTSRVIITLPVQIPDEDKKLS